MAFLALFASCLLGFATAQQVAKTNIEGAPPMPIKRCTRSGGCTTEEASVTLDANWRWFHGVGGGASGNCYTAGKWDETMCTDPKTCTENCGIDGVTSDAYEGTYGVGKAPGGVKLNFVTKGPYGNNVGSRLYLLDGSMYKMFKLKNREFTFDVDVSTLPCGLNGAVYFVEMAEDGGLGGGNKAGAKYGTGYCDAQCPHDVKYMNGEANMKDWDEKASTGHYGHCCTEMDIWEANKFDSAFTPHPCDTEGPLVCEGTKCGDNGKGERYAGVCDKDGCDFNSFRNGDHDFLGPGKKVDTTKPITLVTQWLTHDGTDDGDLVEIKRFYVQDGKVIENSEASITGHPDVKGNSITDEYCSAQKKAFGDRDDHKVKGGLKQMGKVLDRGVVLVMSLWDDKLTRMTWLDTASPAGKPKTDPGVLRGPCPTRSGAPNDLREKHPDSSVIYANIKYGEIGSTFDGGDAVKTDSAAQSPAPAFSSPSPAPAFSATPPVAEASSKSFCCLASTSDRDVCGSCFEGARAEPSSRCGKSESACSSCGGEATWCGGDEGSQDSAASQDSTSSQDSADADEGFCCMASSDSADHCGTCFKGAIAPRDSHCGPSESACNACGGRASWCRGKAPAAEEPADEEGFCCLASPDSKDYCGKCFKEAIVRSESSCGKSSSACHSCGTHSTWCPASKGSTSSEPEYDCEASVSNCASSWTSGKKSYCAKQGSPCPAAEEEEPFCCMASPDDDDFCGKCFKNAKVFSPKHCGKDWTTCHSCGGRAKWCSSDNAGLRKLSLMVTDGRGYLLPEHTEGQDLQLLTEEGVSKVKVVHVDEDGEQSIVQ